MRRIIENLLQRPARKAIYRPRIMNRAPEPPMGFVRRSDPNFYFLARKF